VKFLNYRHAISELSFIYSDPFRFVYHYDGEVLAISDKWKNVVRVITHEESALCPVQLFTKLCVDMGPWVQDSFQTDSPPLGPLVFTSPSVSDVSSRFCK
jgi:hypothetical protein